MALYPLLRPILFNLDPERAHEMSLLAARSLPSMRRQRGDDSVLKTSVAGLNFPSPLGLAAGYDKNAEAPDGLFSLGFGFVEVGTLTPRPQDGNPRPRLFRLEEDRAVINRMGFNNGGQQAALAKLSRRKRTGVLGVNIGANKDSEDRIADYVAGVQAMSPVARYLTINISSPNTPGLRQLQDEIVYAGHLGGIDRQCVDVFGAVQAPAPEARDIIFDAAFEQAWLLRQIADVAAELILIPV